ncbi:MAG TPA: M48 family metalloprotease [Xanthobacteraceae bacterium]|nr:M48 family metalloprotease [Xanthobacteraceae bacterium]
MARPAPRHVGMRFIGRQLRRLRYVIGLALFAGVLAALPGAVSRDSQMPAPEPFPVATSSKTDFLSIERREELRVLDANGGVYEDAQLKGLVTDIVERLAASSDRPDLHYRVVILNSPAVNAFSLPSGRLYVTRGLIALANDASELAAVLSHEIGHVISRHALLREPPIGRGEPLGDFGARAFVVSNFALAGFSRTQEVEADNIGARVSARAGYDPYGAVRILGALSRNAQLRSPGADEVPSSHPATVDRLSIAQTNARRYAVPGIAERDAAVLLANVDGLLYGDDPNGGVVRGRQFLHAGLGFAFMPPPGYSLTRSGEALLGLRAGGGEMLLLEPVAIPREQSLADYLASGWMQNLDRRSIAPASAHGIPAATATAEGSQWSFRILVVRLDKGGVRLIFAAKPGTRDIDRAFRDVADTLRPMTAAEIAAAKPLRLRVVTVQPGDTPAKFARRMAAVDRPLERFLVLNGLSDGQALKAGDRVKLITQDGHIRPPVR